MRIKGTAIAITLAAGLSLGGCATTDRYGYDRYGDRYDNRYGDNRDQLGRTVGGAAVGGAIGAGVGAIVPGVSVGQGAAVGALGGAVVGATTNNRDRGYVSDRRWSRDRDGYCFWVDGSGRRIYDRNVRC